MKYFSPLVKETRHKCFCLQNIHHTCHIWLRRWMKITGYWNTLSLETRWWSKARSQRHWVHVDCFGHCSHGSWPNIWPHCKAPGTQNKLLGEWDTRYQNIFSVNGKLRTLHAKSVSTSWPLNHIEKNGNAYLPVFLYSYPNFMWPNNSRNYPYETHRMQKKFLCSTHALLKFSRKFYSL